MAESEELITAAKNYDISPASHTKAEKLLTYINLHQQEQHTIEQMIENNSTEELMPKLQDIRTRAREIFKEITAE